jgi:hypothetical protein
MPSVFKNIPEAEEAIAIVLRVALSPVGAVGRAYDKGSQ